MVVAIIGVDHVAVGEVLAENAPGPQERMATASPSREWTSSISALPSMAEAKPSAPIMAAIPRPGAGALVGRAPEVSGPGLDGSIGEALPMAVEGEGQNQDQEGHGRQAWGLLQTLTGTEAAGQPTILLVGGSLIVPDTEEATSSNLVPPTMFLQVTRRVSTKYAIAKVIAI
jgi:hypothetical protein